VSPRAAMSRFAAATSSPGAWSPAPRPEWDAAGAPWRVRTHKPLYGWVCATCVRELDLHYLLVTGLKGGDVVSLFVIAQQAHHKRGPSSRSMGPTRPSFAY
jgi:hypothetical protein